MTIDEEILLTNNLGLIVLVAQLKERRREGAFTNRLERCVWTLSAS